MTHWARLSNSVFVAGVHHDGEVALAVELAALVVEAMGELVADDHADRAVVDRVDRCAC